MSKRKGADKFKPLRRLLGIATVIGTLWGGQLIAERELQVIEPVVVPIIVEIVPAANSVQIENKQRAPMQQIAPIPTIARPKPIVNTRSS